MAKPYWASFWPQDLSTSVASLLCSSVLYWPRLALQSVGCGQDSVLSLSRPRFLLQDRGYLPSALGCGSNQDNTFCTSTVLLEGCCWWELESPGSAVVPRKHQAQGLQNSIDGMLLATRAGLCSCALYVAISMESSHSTQPPPWVVCHTELNHG